MEIISLFGKSISVESCVKIISVSLLLIASFVDIRKKRISLFFPVTLMIISVCFLLHQMQSGSIKSEDLLLSFVPGGILLIVCFISRQGIGIGDGLLVMSIGPLLGMIDTLLAILIAFTLSAIVGAVLLMIHKANGKSKLAFIPFLTAGVGVMCFAL